MANYYLIALVGLFLSSAFCRLFTIVAIKEGRTLKAFFFLIMFATFCFLYLVSVLALSAFWREVGRTTLLISLALGNLFEWREFWLKMREKDKVFHDVHPEPETHTLKAIAAAGVPVSLVAVEKPTTEAETTQTPQEPLK